MRWTQRLFLCLISSFLFSPLALAANHGMTLGPVALESIGPMTFTDSGILLIGDPKSATLYAIDPEDEGSPANAKPELSDLLSNVTKTLEWSGEVSLGELAVNPVTGSVFMTLSNEGEIHLVKVAGNQSLTQVNLDKIPHLSKALPNAPEDKDNFRRGRNRNPRLSSITDIAFFDGKIMVTGVAAGASPSRVLEIPFPFADNSVATSVEIFHAAHGRVEDATIKTFLPMVIDGEPSLLAGFTCTPLVHFPVDDLEGQTKVRGTTVAELGNRNTPLDMIVYEKDGVTSILMTNTSRGTMKIGTKGIAQREGLSKPVPGGGTAGQPFERIEALDNIKQMDQLSDSQAVAVFEDSGKLNLKTFDLP